MGGWGKYSEHSHHEAFSAKYTFSLINLRKSYCMSLRAVSVACNNGASGFTGKNITSRVYLTEPQGKIKNL